MSNSAFRKVQKSKQKPHRERAQVLERQHLGILEKKKDYKLRATNFKNKEKQLKALKKKALERNPDEFYWGMMKNKIDNGVHWFDNADDEKNITEVQRKLMESQDLNYIRLNLQKEQKKVEKLEEKLRMTTAGSRPKCHIVFGSKFSKSSQEFLEGGEMTVLKSGYSKKEIGKMKKTLQDRKTRLKELRVVRGKLENQRTIRCDKDVQRRETVAKETKERAAVYKWSRIRKK